MAHLVSVESSTDAPAPRIVVGIDLVEVARIAAVHRRHPERFLTRHFTAQERSDCRSDHRRLATRWAAKEATAKALGTGIGPIGWADVEVIRGARGAPVLRLTGKAARRASELGLTSWSVSLSHTTGHAVAIVAGAG